MKKRKNPSITKVIKWIKQHPDLLAYFTWVPPGHFYSPIPMREDILRRKSIIYDENKPYWGIQLDSNEQMILLNKLILFIKNHPFHEYKTENYRYHFNNEWFPKSDALLLYALLRYIKPKKIIEVGSGYSSAVMLDTCEHFSMKSTELSFIEPNIERLKSLMKKSDEKAVLKETFVQLVDIDFFLRLQENDILFIDSSHVTKAGSDVNYLFFEVLPRLKKGVLVHFHDIFFNFEYPLEWVLEGRSWNESYLLRAFMQYNSNFEILFFNDFFQKHQQSFLKDNVPEFIGKTSGSFWIRKVK